MKLSQLASRVRVLRKRTEQLSALRGEESRMPGRIARLERALDFERAAAHVRGAIEAAAPAVHPVPHLVVPELLPSDAYREIIDAIPAPIFFEGRIGEGQHLRVPPRLAPAHVIVAWAFVTDVLGPLSAVLAARVGEARAGTLTVIEGRLVRRTPGYAGAVAAADRSRQVLMGVLCLARPHDTEEYGSRLGGVLLPFRANTALVYVGAPELHAYADIPSTAPADVERYTYEFSVGPPRDSRRAPDALAGQAG